MKVSGCTIVELEDDCVDWQVRSLMGADVDYINEQITKVTRLPNAPERSQPHLGNTGHQTQQQQQQTTAGQMRSLGSFSVVVPIYLGAIFVFFVYIVAKVTYLRSICLLSQFVSGRFC